MTEGSGFRRQAIAARLRLGASRWLPGMRSVDVVVCVHNALDDVRACLASLTANTRRPFGLILVDDGSDAETGAFLRQFAAQHSNVTCLRNEAARGYTRAANQGLRASAADFVVLLNSDAIVTRDWLQRLVDAARARPDGGVFGPLSNAAGWQSIPNSTGEDGGFVVNSLPAGASLAVYARAIAAKPDPLYPRAWLVNGFCYMVTREAIETVGRLDEETFPLGYGEEDDYSLRALRAGFKAYVVDNSYVFHAKSKSFTTARRRELIAPAQERLHAKHTKERVSLAISETRQNEDLERARVHSTLLAEAAVARPVRPGGAPGLRIGWVLAGDALAPLAAATAEAVARRGGRSALIAAEGRRALRGRGAVRSIRLAEARAQRFDAIAFADPVPWSEVRRIPSPLYLQVHASAPDSPRAAEPPEAAPDGAELVHVADWRPTAERLAAGPGRRVAGVFAGGIDRDRFRPLPRAQAYQVGCLGTEWLDDATVLAVLRATVGLRRLELTQADLAGAELPSLLAQCRIVVAGARPGEGGLLPLQAMACGVPVLVADDGGAPDYAEDGVNALVVGIGDPEALREGVRKLLINNVLRRKLIRNGLRTAWQFDWASAAERLVDFVEAIRAEQRDGISGAERDGRPQP